MLLKPFRGLKPEVFEADFQLQVMGAIKALQAASEAALAFPQLSVAAADHVRMML